jgi:hypothetical protein
LKVVLWLVTFWFFTVAEAFTFLQSAPALAGLAAWDANEVLEKIKAKIANIVKVFFMMSPYS